jgi:hypothetical protein
MLADKSEDKLVGMLADKSEDRSEEKLGKLVGTLADKSEDRSVGMLADKSEPVLLNLKLRLVKSLLLI